MPPNEFIYGSESLLANSLLPLQNQDEIWKKKPNTTGCLVNRLEDQNSKF